MVSRNVTPCFVWELPSVGQLFSRFELFFFCGIKNNSYICIVNSIDMPEIFRFYGFSFFFYSKEHEPLHVHVEGKGGCAKFDLVDDEFVMVEKINIKANDLKRIKEVIADNKDIIINRWNEYFK
jgi:hypothetical protein